MGGMFWDFRADGLGTDEGEVWFGLLSIPCMHWMEYWSVAEHGIESLG